MWVVMIDVYGNVLQLVEEIGEHEGGTPVAAL